MIDGEIRFAVRGVLEERHADVLHDTLFRNELGLCLGQTRVDVAVINGALSGYEIKSARDTLARFPAQVKLYGQVLDYATVVTEPRFVDRVGSEVPEFWGIWEAVDAGAGVAAIRVVRAERRNPEIDPLSLAQLLWRDEAYDELSQRSMATGLGRATRWQLWDRLAELPLDELRTIVRHRLKTRTDWSGG